MGAFAVAAVFAGEYRDRRWVPWLAYGTAGLIGASRVALDRHFVADVVAGGVLGSSLGRMVVARERGAEHGAGDLGGFEPIVEPSRRTYGLVYRRSW